MATNRDIYNEIAQSWYNYRHWSRFGAELKDMAGRWESGKLLNVGCAHGPDFLPFTQGFELWGVDFSNRMIGLAKKYAAKFNFSANLITADACSLPFPDAFFDYAVSIATYHHIPGKEQRKLALRELRRVLKPGAEVFITVWNRWQPSFWRKRKEAKIAWKSKNEIFYRYYYLFSYGEIERLLDATGFNILCAAPEKRYRFPLKYFSRNICIRAQAV